MDWYVLKKEKDEHKRKGLVQEKEMDLKVRNGLVQEK